MDRGVGASGNEGGGSRFLGVGGSLVGKDLRRSSFLHILVTFEIADEVGSRRSLYEGVEGSILLRTFVLCEIAGGEGSCRRLYDEFGGSILLRIFVAYGIAHEVGNRRTLLDRNTSRLCTCFFNRC